MHIMTRSILALLTLGAALFSCNKTPSAEEPATPADPEKLLVVVNGISPYSVAYAGDSGNARAFVAALKDLTGVELASYSATEKSGTLEILIGRTERPETAEALKELGGKQGYVIKPVGEKLVIAGINDTWTALALHEFQKKVLKVSAYLAGNSLTIPRSLVFKEAYAEGQLIARLLQRGYTFTLRPTLVMNCPGENNMTIAQGAASDGQFFYFVNRTSDESSSIVYKYDMATLSQVAKSATFYAGHCNDMTYDAAKKRLVIAHGQSEGKILTPVSAQDLAVQTDITIKVGSGAITYNDFKGGYAISQGGSTFYVTDRDLNVTLSKSRTDVHTGYTAQGMGSDDFYVYFPMSGSKDNALVTYDWEGKFIRILSIPLTLESESMFYAAGNYYVNFYLGSRKGAGLYRIDPVYTYKYAK